MEFISSYRCFYMARILSVFTFFLFSYLAAEAQDSRSHTVLVSVAPHKFFVEQLAGDTVKVGLLVPAGTSFHTFEPTPKQVMAACRSDIWFRIGESFETRIVQALQSHCPGMRLVDLRQNLDLIVIDPHGACCCTCSHAAGADLHIWLSPKLAKIQAKTIADALSAVYPEKKEEFQKRLEHFLKALDDLDGEIAKILQPLTKRVIMVSHPAYAYFARDYSLTQLPIEFEGKDPTPRQLTTILTQAREAQIKAIYIQPQYGSKGARLIAQELGAEVITLDPYAENYLETMREIARSFATKEKKGVSDK